MKFICLIFTAIILSASAYSQTEIKLEEINNHIGAV
jgi:hypothetical protein